MKLFYSSVRFPDATIFDPFMGSGTTLIEALKLDARVLGRDINPVAFFLVKNAIARHSREEIIDAFSAIERDVAPILWHYYTTQLEDGSHVPVLYYFWVKQVPCASCHRNVDLFSSYVFARHAYPKRFPDAQVLCPRCGTIECVRFDSKSVTCNSCELSFHPSEGPARGRSAQCPCCNAIFSIGRAVRLLDGPPAHRLYAKLVLLPDGRKEYLSVNDYDLKLFAEAEEHLGLRDNAFPIIRIEPGYNTNQVLNYNYKYWHEFFNSRQLLCLSILVERIRDIPNQEVRELFTCLFSGVLEFNNMFASYKGEGTGAVRHMFSHHILKPERNPLEANPWGTHKSSGAFSTMFKTRILRALDYAADPFELPPGGSRAKKQFGLSKAIGCYLAPGITEFNGGRRAYITCGDSSHTDIPSASVDAVVTDPPFFDNVHYSQLADFFYVWQRHILGANRYWNPTSTRAGAEVQHVDPDTFSDRLCAVWRECHRVLRDDGVMVFTYHHSRSEGWRCVLEALLNAGFGIVAVHPVKSEMSVAAPKAQAREPIDIDVIVVCRKTSELRQQPLSEDLVSESARKAATQVKLLSASQRRLSRNDVRVIVMSNVIRLLSAADNAPNALSFLESNRHDIEALISSLYAQLGNGASRQNVR